MIDKELSSKELNAEFDKLKGTITDSMYWSKRCEILEGAVSGLIDILAPLQPPYVQDQLNVLEKVWDSELNKLDKEFGIEDDADKT